MNVVGTTGAIRRAKLQSNRHHQHPTFYTSYDLRVTQATGKVSQSVLIYRVECLYACKFVRLFVILNSAPLRSAQHMIHILNQHDPGSALVDNSCALTVC